MRTERAMFKFHNFSLTAWFWISIMFAAASARGERALTWEQGRVGFEQSNPTLLADKLSVDESRAQEITAFLRPNPTFTLSADGTQIAPEKSVWRPFAGTFESPSISYLHERQHKRELRLESAKKATLIAESSHANLQRTLLFNLRVAFVATLQAKAVLQLARDNLAYYDRLLEIITTRSTIIRLASIRSAPVSAFTCAFSPAPRERSCARNSISRAMRDCATPPKQPC